MGPFFLPAPACVLPVRSPCTTFARDLLATCAFPRGPSQNPGIWCAPPRSSAKGRNSICRIRQKPRSRKRGCVLWHSLGWRDTTFLPAQPATWSFAQAPSRNPGIWCALPPARHQIPSWRCGELGFYQGPLPKSRNLVRASSQQCQRTQFHLPDPAKAQVAKSWLRPLALTRLGGHHIPSRPTCDLGFCQGAFPKSWNLVRTPSPTQKPAPPAIKT